MFKAGYNLVVKSWENDGDCQNTCVYTVDTEDEMMFWLEFLKKFYSRGYKNDEGYSNRTEINTQKVIEYCNQLRKKNGLEKWCWDELLDIMYDITGPCDNDDIYFRVVEDVKVYYLDDDMVADYEW